MMKRYLSAAVLAAAVCFTLPANAQSGYTQTKHPIVLVHGLFGFDAIGPLDYWWGVPSALRSGGATVFVPQQSAANSSEVRGEQLLAELRRLQAAYGYQKFNLIGHSHGGHTIRYVAGVAPELVASATSVGTPHAGSPVADSYAASLDGSGTTQVVATIANIFGGIISLLSGQSRPQNSEAAMRSLTTQGSASFSQRFPAGMPVSACGEGLGVANGVRYYSIGGTGVITTLIDPSDALLALSSLRFNGASNDGLVGRCSSHWGVVLRDDYPWNHLDQVNQAFGLRGLFTPNPLSFYRSHANRLKAAGL